MLMTLIQWECIEDDEEDGSSSFDVSSVKLHTAVRMLLKSFAVGGRFFSLQLLHSFATEEAEEIQLLRIHDLERCCDLLDMCQFS
jgi:hypothetical protein